MTEIVALKKAEPEFTPTFNNDHVEWLMEAVQRNRFLPRPDPDSIFVGDGNFQAVGAEFLGHFIRKGGVQPESRVLDIGCGIGRMAVPLTQYLDPAKGSYRGIDPVTGGINWCQQKISPAYPNFEFRHLDIAHSLYNPKGAVNGLELKLPFESRQFDFIIMTSVVTHLPDEEVNAYLQEVERVLAPGGRLFMTAFVVDKTAQENAFNKRDARLGFQRYDEGPCWFVPELPPLAAVGFDDGFLDNSLTRAGLSITTKSLGHWRGVASDHYQDLFIAECKGDT
ncbi:class I SAM-dependent methyltransferase [Phyllobacterium brassicacearum]|nr:class I SAM-dependent methyltransferase [Phyllobacterium brassicacearum]TDQ33476.1 methyltransferase family protein [Phyllobacterium brassicacearum]